MNCTNTVEFVESSQNYLEEHETESYFTLEQ